MFGLVIFGAAAVLGISLGFQGLVMGSVPWSRTQRITGRWARVIGLPCLLLGLYLAWAIVAVLSMAPA